MDFGFLRHNRHMRSLEEIKAKLSSLGDGPAQKDVAARLKIPQSAVSNIANDKRHLRYKEALTIMQMLWPDDPYGVGDNEVEKRVNEEWSIAIDALLHAQKTHPDIADLTHEVLQAIRADMRSAAAIGDDPAIAARSVARALWRPKPAKGRD